jgi:hypothetical protein
MSVIGSNAPAQDAVLLLNLTTSGNTSNASNADFGSPIDTNGQGFIVWEISGNSAYQIMIEGSHDQYYWSTIWSLPVSELSQVDTINQAGHYHFETSTRYIRYRISYTNGPINFTCYGRAGGGPSAADRISQALDSTSNVALSVAINNLKKDGTGALFLSDAAGPFTATLENASTVQIYDTTGYNNIVVQQNGGGSTAVAISNDGSNWYAAQGVNLQTGAIVTTLAASAIIAFSCAARYIRFTGTSTSGQIITYFRTTDDPAVIDTINLAEIGGSAVSSTSAQLGINIVNAAGTTLAAAGGGGSAKNSIGVTQSTAIAQADVSAGAFNGAGRVNGTVISSTQGGGSVISAEFNVSALTLGSATAVFAILQESSGGTNFTDIWVSDPITTTGIVRVPAIPIQGRRRWAVHSAGGTSTTVTVSVATLELPTGTYPFTRQFRDYYSATNPFATVINGTTQTASSLVLTTLGSTTTLFNVEGCLAYTFFVTVTGGVPSTNPVLTIQLSQDGTSWANTSSNVTPTAAGTFMTALSNFPAKYARLIVSTASSGGTAYTLGNVGVYGID